ncbi:MAG: hypothetical protein R3E89_02675 [Thiolinea sp.]
MTAWSAAGIFLVAYLILVAIAARRPDLEMDDPDAPLLELAQGRSGRTDRAVFHPADHCAAVVHPD